jgi:hypothetical protein
MQRFILIFSLVSTLSFIVVANAQAHGNPSLALRNAIKAFEAGDQPLERSLQDITHLYGEQSSASFRTIATDHDVVRPASSLTLDRGLSGNVDPQRIVTEVPDSRDDLSKYFKRPSEAEYKALSRMDLHDNTALGIRKQLVNRHHEGDTRDEVMTELMCQLMSELQDESENSSYNEDDVEEYLEEATQNLNMVASGTKVADYVDRFDQVYDLTEISPRHAAYFVKACLLRR